MRIFLILLMVLICSCPETQGQTVVSVPSGDTVVLSTGSVVKLRGITLSQDVAQQKRARASLTWMVLDRQVSLNNVTDLEWGEKEATVSWKGTDVGDILRSKGYSPQATQYVATPSTTYSQPVVRYTEAPQAPVYYTRPQQQIRYYRVHSSNCPNGVCPR